MADCLTQKPRLVATGSGFSILYTVEYKGRFLYSKYSPTRSICSIVQNMAVQPSTLVLVNSPALFYGLVDLLQKLPDDCVVLAVEDDDNLLELARSSLENLKEKNPRQDFSSVHLFSTKHLLDLDSFIREAVNTGKIRRTLSIDFSAGKSFNPKIYELVFSAAQEIVATFWKNRVTLVKMGRLFSKNIMENLKSLDSGFRLSDVARTVEKPILVLGAGESLDSTLSPASPLLSRILDEDFFVITVDASLTSVLERGIKVDATVGLESQFAIQKAYIGSHGCGTVFFADLCSRPQVQRMFKERTVWFASDFAPGKFLDRIKTFLPDFIPPLGSVGLAAVHIALSLRKDDSVPVFVSGLDLSYSIGKTHAKGTPAHKARLSSCGRIFSIDNLDAAFSPAASLVTGKDGRTMATTPSMLSYRQNFFNNFSASKNLFDIGKSGLDLGIQKIDGKQAEALSENVLKKIRERTESRGKTSTDKSSTAEKNMAAKIYLDEERLALTKIRDLLSMGEKSQFFEKGTGLSSQIENLLSGREYLYLHFPDGYRLSMDQGFLKRVRAEIDFFLKAMKD